MDELWKNKQRKKKSSVPDNLKKKGQIQSKKNQSVLRFKQSSIQHPVEN